MIKMNDAANILFFLQFTLLTFIVGLFISLFNSFPVTSICSRGNLCSEVFVTFIWWVCIVLYNLNMSHAISIMSMKIYTIRYIIGQI